GSRLSLSLDGALLATLEDATHVEPGSFGASNYTDAAQTLQAVEFLDLDQSATDGWEDLLALLTPEIVAQTGNGWRLEGGVLRSGTERYGLISLPGTFAGTSYQMRVKLRRRGLKQ